MGTDWLPRRLPAIGDRASNWLRPLWLLLLAFAVMCDIGGTAYVLHDMYETRPAFTRLGLSVEVGEPGGPTVSPIGNMSTRLGISEGSRILAVNGRQLRGDIGIEDLAKSLQDAPGDVVAVRIAPPRGNAADYRLTRSRNHAQQAEAGEWLGRDGRFAIRILTSLLACAILLLCATLLFLRRPRDPVAMLLSFGFLLMAATIDPPLTAWLALGFGDEFDVVSTGGWMLVLIALAAFPDGRFVPDWLRWIIPLAFPMGVMLALDEVDTTLQIVIGILVPLVLLGLQILRYRKLTKGIEGQQIKWAAFGFAAGFVLVGIAVASANNFADDNSVSVNLLIVAAFNIGFVLLPLGLMISLIQFRLWEADVVITRSAAYAVVTILVGIVWATSTDLVKELVNSTLGQANATVSASISAVLAAGLFAPTQALVLRWTKKRFGKQSDKLHSMTQRLPAWSATASPAELGMRALAAIADSVHASRSAVLTLTPTGRELVAARGIDQPDELTAPEAVPENDPRFPLHLPLEDEDGAIGTLLLGPRSDGNRYNRDEREALQALAEPLAEAIRRAMARVQREAGVHRMISSVEERLAQIESGLRGPDPATA